MQAIASSSLLRNWATAAAVLAVAIGCASGSRPTSTPALQQTPTAPSATPAQSIAAAPPSHNIPSALPSYQPTIVPANFSNQITNQYFPLKPGTVLIYDGVRDGTVPRHHEVTVTTETKQILGVDCVVVRDVVTTNAALVEKTTDWYAQDAAGNVWYFGEDTAEYVNGQVSSTAGTWMGGVDGALPGIIMEANSQVGDAYRQEFRPGVAEDFATVMQIGTTASTPGGDFTNVVVTQDIDLLDPSKLDAKHYAPGVGLVATEGTAGGHTEVTKLTQSLQGQ